MENPASNYYLSEMSVSDRHGGGLTLQRVLDGELGIFSRFIHPGRFGMDYPPAEEYRDRSLDLPTALDSDTARRWLGWRPSAWLSGRPALRRWWASAAARKLASTLRGDDGQMSRWLVCPQSDLSLRIIASLQNLQRLEYVTWMMDDHLVRYNHATQQWQYRPEHRRLLGAHLHGARRVFVISPAMKELYAREFEVDSTVLFAPGVIAGEPVWEPPTPRGQPLRLGYFGALGEWQRDALELLLPSVTSGEAMLDVFTSSHLPENWDRIAGLRRLDPLPPAAVPAIMRECDAVVLPISFMPAMAHMTRLNIATKMAECLASGTPTLLIGPPEAAMTRYLQGTGAAALVTESTPAAARARLRELRDPDMRRALLGAARDLCLKSCSPEAMRAVWRRGTAGFFNLPLKMQVAAAS